MNSRSTLLTELQQLRLEKLRISADERLKDSVQIRTEASESKINACRSKFEVIRGRTTDAGEIITAVRDISDAVTCLGDNIAKSLPAAQMKVNELMVKKEEYERNILYKLDERRGAVRNAVELRSNNFDELLIALENVKREETDSLQEAEELLAVTREKFIALQKEGEEMVEILKKESQYNDLCSEELESICMQIEEDESNLAANLRNIEDLKFSLAENEESATYLGKECEEYEVEHGDLCRELEAMQRKINESAAELSKLENESAICTANADAELQSLRKNLEGERAEVLDRVSKSKSDIVEVESKIAETEADIELVLSDIRASCPFVDDQCLDSTHVAVLLNSRKQAIESELASKRTELDTLMKQVTDMQNGLSMRSEYQIRIQSAEKETDSIRIEIEQFQSKITELRARQQFYEQGRMHLAAKLQFIDEQMEFLRAAVKSFKDLKTPAKAAPMPNQQNTEYGRSSDDDEPMNGAPFRPVVPGLRSFSPNTERKRNTWKHSFDSVSLQSFDSLDVNVMSDSGREFEVVRKPQKKSNNKGQKRGA